jgi:hypothetical protein
MSTAQQFIDAETALRTRAQAVIPGGMYGRQDVQHLGARVSYQIARNPLFRPLIRHVSKNQRRG